MKKYCVALLLIGAYSLAGVVALEASTTKTTTGSESKVTTEQAQSKAAKVSEGSDEKVVDPKQKVSDGAPEHEMSKQAYKSSSPTQLKVVESGLAAGMENRSPIDSGDKFSSTVKKLYCFTKVTGGKEGSQVIHRWKKGEEVMASVTLAVNGSPWRTFSSKNIMPEWTGSWTVDVMDGETIITTLPFIIE